MLYLSVSAIKDYLQCPKIYWYRVNKKQAFVPDKYIIRGNIVHAAIEKCDNEDDAILFIHKMFKEHESYGTTTDELEAITMVHNYFVDIESCFTARDKNYIEMSFKIPWETYGVNIVGKIDRIDRETNSVYDWKTSIQLPDAYELQDMQFYMYAWAYEALYHEKPKVYYGHLYSGEILPIDIREDTWYNYKQVIHDLTYKLSVDKKDGFYPRLFGYKCKKCFYKGACWSDYELGD